MMPQIPIARRAAARLLPPSIQALCALLLCAPLAAQELRTVSFRVLALEHAEGIEEVLAPAGDNRQEPVTLFTSGSSEPVRGTFRNNEAVFYMPGAEPGKEPQVAARGPLARSSRQWFLLTPSGTKEIPYRIHAYDDDLEAFPAGRVRVINLSPGPVRFALDDKYLPPIAPGASALLPKPAATNAYQLYPVTTEFQDGNGKWVVAQKADWKSLRNRREIVITLIHPKNKQPSVRKFADTPPASGEG